MLIEHLDELGAHARCVCNPCETFVEIGERADNYRLLRIRHVMVINDSLYLHSLVILQRCTQPHATEKVVFVGGGGVLRHGYVAFRDAPSLKSLQFGNQFVELIVAATLHIEQPNTTMLHSLDMNFCPTSFLCSLKSLQRYNKKTKSKHFPPFLA